MEKSLLKSILITWLIAGTLDILAAFISYLAKGGENVLIVLKYIASALFGKEAFSEGALMPTLGLLFHYLIALGWTVLFYLIYSAIHKLRINPYFLGVLYGIFVWIMMNLVILPLTKVQQGPFEWKSVLTGCLILIFAIGIPIAVGANRYFRGNSSNGS